MEFSIRVKRVSRYGPSDQDIILAKLQNERVSNIPPLAPSPLPHPSAFLLEVSSFVVVRSPLSQLTNHENHPACTHMQHSPLATRNTAAVRYNCMRASGPPYNHNPRVFSDNRLFLHTPLTVSFSLNPQINELEERLSFLRTL
jgi:hypothetical protein